jgi:hypothetical protein
MGSSNMHKGISLRTAATEIERLCESNRNLGRHEAVHAVLARMFGATAGIENHDGYAKTNFSGELSVEQRIMILIGPEIYMKKYGFYFIQGSVTDDREAVAKLLKSVPDAEAVKDRLQQKLDGVFTWPQVRSAIEKLTEKTGSHPGAVNPVSCEKVQSLVDPILSDVEFG